MNATRLPTMPPVEEMTRAYLASDASYRGLLYVAVRTTGIFCLPTCPARKPLPKNVEFFPTPDEAVAAGYRACKRCRPTAAGEQPAWAVELIREVEADPAARISEADLTARGLEPATVRRHFLRTFGQTFQAFARAKRLAAAQEQLRLGGSVDEAVFDSGYQSHSGFREAFAQLFGAPPAAATHKHRIAVTWIDSPLGPLVAGATDAGLCLLEFSEPARLEPQLAALRRHFELPIVPGPHEHLARAARELAEYFAGRLQKFTVPLVYPGSPFQRRAWEELLKIPYGQTRSYEELAAAVGSPRAVRAVGSANGRNRLAIVIPCHRVVNKSGALGGYGGGLRRKEFLLHLEQKSAVV